MYIQVYTYIIKNRKQHTEVTDIINTYLGTFNNTQELKEFNKQSKIAEYKNLAKRFNSQPSMELSSMMSDLALTLVNTFSLTWEEVEQLES